MKRLLSILLILAANLQGQAPYESLLLLAPAAAAGGGAVSPAVESVYTNSFLTGGATSTHSITVSSADALLVVHVCLGDNTAASAAPTAMTYNLDPLTKSWGTNGATFVRSDGWYLADPDVGTADLIITYLAAGADQVSVIVTVITNLHQTVPLGTVVTASGSGTAPSVTVAGATSDLMFCGVCTDSGGTLTAATGAIVNKVLNVGIDTASGVLTNAGGASVAMTFTTDSEEFAIGGVAIKKP